MWEDRELERRRREAILDKAKGLESVTDPGEYLKKLRDLGYLVTLRSASRDQKEPGAVFPEGHDPIPSWTDTADESPFRKVQGLILTVRTVAPCQVFVRTVKNAGLAVVEAIDRSHWEEILGTVVDHSSILLFTENQSLRDLLMQHLKFFSDRYAKAGGGTERQRFHE